MNGVSQSIKSITDRLVRLGVKFHETSMIAQSIHVLYVKWNGTDAWKYSSVAAFNVVIPLCPSCAAGFTKSHCAMMTCCRVDATHGSEDCWINGSAHSVR